MNAGLPGANAPGQVCPVVSRMWVAAGCGWRSSTSGARRHAAWPGGRSAARPRGGGRLAAGSAERGQARLHRRRGHLAPVDHGLRAISAVGSRRAAQVASSVTHVRKRDRVLVPGVGIMHECASRDCVVVGVCSYDHLVTLVWPLNRILSDACAAIEQGPERLPVCCTPKASSLDAILSWLHDCNEVGSPPTLVDELQHALRRSVPLAALHKLCLLLVFLFVPCTLCPRTHAWCTHPPSQANAIQPITNDHLQNSPPCQYQSAASAAARCALRQTPRPAAAPWLPGWSTGASGSSRSFSVQCHSGIHRR